MKLPWITLLCCAAAGPAAWLAGRARTEAVSSPAAPPVIASAPAQPTPPKPVLPKLLAAAAAAENAPEALTRQQQLHAAARLLAEASAAEARELFLTTDSAFLQECAARRWAELEPRAALDHLLKLDAQAASLLPAGLEALSRAVFAGWASRDPASALAAAEPLRQREGFRHALSAAGCQAISDDVTRGLALCVQYGSILSEKFPGQPLRRIWEHQPAEFTRALFALPEGGKFDAYGLRFGIESAKVWAARDTAGFVAWAAQHFRSGTSKPDGFQESRFNGELFGLLLEHDPDAAGTAFANTPPSELRNLMRRQYVGVLAAEDPQAATAWIDDNLTSGREAAYRLWAETIAKTTGHEQAAVLALNLPPGKARDAAAEAALYAWTGKDAGAALTWAQSQPAPVGGRAPITYLSSYWLLRHGEEAGRYILTHPDLEWGGGGIRSAVLRVPFAEAVTLLRGLPASRREEAARALGERLAEGTHRAAEIAALPAPMQTLAVQSAAAQLHGTDPAQAAAWIAALPAGPLRTAGEEAVRRGK